MEKQAEWEENIDRDDEYYYDIDGDDHKEIEDCELTNLWIYMRDYSNVIETLENQIFELEKETGKDLKYKEFFDKIVKEVEKMFKEKDWIKEI